MQKQVIIHNTLNKSPQSYSPNISFSNATFNSPNSTFSHTLYSNTYPTTVPNIISMNSETDIIGAVE